MAVAFFSGPGGGKGRQSSRLRDIYGGLIFETGGRLRRLHKAGALSAEVGALMDQGRYAPDDFVLKMFREVSRTFPEKGMWIFDGFPRTAVQITPFVETCHERHRRVFAVELLVPDDVLRTRCLARHDEERRTDDASSVFEERLRVYHDHRKEFDTTFRLSGSTVVSVIGDADVETVATRVREALSRSEHFADETRRIFSPPPSA